MLRRFVARLKVLKPNLIVPEAPRRCGPPAAGPPVAVANPAPDPGFRQNGWPARQNGPKRRLRSQVLHLARRS